MEGDDSNKAALGAVLNIIESWIERDRNALARVNGMAATPNFTLADEGKRAYGVLKQSLPPHAYTNLIAGIANMAPRALMG